MSIRELQEQVDALAQAVKQYCSNRSCSCCEGPHNGGNCPNFFNQPPQHRMETYSCEHCGGIPHPSFDCQTGNTPVFDQGPHFSNDYQAGNNSLTVVSDHYIAPATPHAYTPSLPFLATMEPADTFLMEGEVISTTLERENDEFIKSSVDDHDPIPRESEVTSVYDDLKCDMPVNTPLPTTNVREENFDINLPLGEYVVDFLMENEDVAGLPRHLVKYLFNYLLKNLSLTKVMSDEPLGDDSKSISYDVTFLNPLFDFNDDSTLCYDNLLFDEEFEDISSLDPPESTLVIDESSLLVTPLPDPKKICLREVEIFDLFLSLTQSRGTTRVMETPSFRYHLMPSPRPAAYSPKELMYRFYHPLLTSGDGFDHGPKMK
ncbi:hypothetical protein Tco_0564916 [Tanacetum coccineum]